MITAKRQPPVVVSGSSCCARTAGPARTVRQRPVLGAVHRSRRNPVRGVRQLQRGAGQAKDNHNQVLITKSTDGGQTFGPLVHEADYNDLPDCPTYQGGQDPGVACVPEKGSSQDSVFRAANYPAAGVNPCNPRQVVVTFASYVSQRLEQVERVHPARVRSRHVRGAIRRREDAERVQQRDRRTAFRTTQAPRSRDEAERGIAARREPGSHAGEDRPVVPVGRVLRGRDAGGVVFRPAVRKR